jgi:hypothetical protein
MKTFKVCTNGFIKYFDGQTIHLFFYNHKTVKDLIELGIKRVY